MARALLICRGDILAAGVMRGWLESGNEIAEIWASPTDRIRTSQRLVRTLCTDWTVARLAARHAIPIFENPQLRKWAGAGRRVAGGGADTLITAVTMQIVPAELLALFGRRAVNFHPAMLPEYRGPSPYLGVLLDGRENDSSGVTLHQLVAGIDEGPIIAQQKLSFDASGRRYQRWLVANAAAARDLARTALPAYLDGRIEAVPQGAGSYRRVREEAIVDARTSFADAQRMLVRIGFTGRARVQLPDGRKAVQSIERLGSPEGRPAWVTPWSIDMDIADARVRLRRWTMLDRALAKLELIAALRSADRRQE